LIKCKVQYIQGYRLLWGIEDIMSGYLGSDQQDISDLKEQIPSIENRAFNNQKQHPETYLVSLGIYIAQIAILRRSKKNGLNRDQHGFWWEDKHQAQLALRSVNTAIKSYKKGEYNGS